MTSGRDLVSSVSPKGQVTIPVEIRRLLGVNPKDKVRFEVDGGTVQLRPARSVLDDLYMSLPGLRHRRSWEEIEQIAREDRAARLVSEGCEGSERQG